jgi:hypothetical protein
MAAFALPFYTFISLFYTYILITLYIKSILARDKPAFNILDKLYYNKLSSLILDGP